ncbi:Aconitase/3-isopropylmalate dehydratase [Ilyonectria destructans]|nr:Aconitase/3-isopropylmalate dehydratase [Ilyonectria destructans]
MPDEVFGEGIPGGRRSAEYRPRRPIGSNPNSICVEAVGFWHRFRGKSFQNAHILSPKSGTGLPASPLESLIDRVESSIPKGDHAAKATTRILPGFPKKVSGEILFCDADNLDTDNMYPGKFTYQDDITTEGMAAMCMSNYDPDFRSVAKPNDILVSGYNFGCGSSREQM